MTRKDVFWYLLLIASFIAAGVSLLTTALGLNRYVSFVLAWPLALAVQVGLFGLAWLIAVGQRRLRPLIIALYCLTMPFSVVFSYVMLQSEFTATVKPEEAQRLLYDDLRQRSTQVATEVNQSIAESEGLSVRLASWLDMEQATGWTTSTCDESDHCYLAGVCDRIHEKIANWEAAYQRPYRQGPGQQLIYGLLDTEQQALQQTRSTLVGFRDAWLADDTVFQTGIDNRERLRRFDTALMQVPALEIQAVRCNAVTLPTAPPYELYARDGALDEERPVYAFEDLARIMERSHRFERSDYPTIFALGLAIFVDLFVLLVAIGAAVLEAKDDEENSYPAFEPVPPEWGEPLQRDITGWIDGSRLLANHNGQGRQEFLAAIIESLRFDKTGRVMLVPTNEHQRRFGHLLISAHAARPAGMGMGLAEHESPTFLLEGWVYPALAKYMARAHGEADAGGSAGGGGTEVLGS